MGQFSLPQPISLSDSGPPPNANFYPDGKHESLQGHGPPEGRVLANIGDKYLDLDTVSVWRKIFNDGYATGWRPDSNTDISILDFAQDGESIANGLNDDIAAIQRAVDAVETAIRHSNVYSLRRINFPAPPQDGYYRITSPIQINISGIELVGETVGTLIKNVTSGSNVIEINRDETGGGILYNVRVEKLMLIGTGVTSRAIYANQISHFFFDINTILHPGPSVYMESVSQVGLTGCDFGDIRVIAQPQQPVTCITDKGGWSNKYRSCSFERCDIGVYLWDANGVVFENPRFEDINRTGEEIGIKARNTSTSLLTKMSIVVHGMTSENAGVAGGTSRRVIDADDSYFVVVNGAKLVGGIGDWMKLDGGGRLSGVNSEAGARIESEHTVEIVGCENVYGLVANLHCPRVASLPISNGTNSVTDSWFNKLQTWSATGANAPTITFNANDGFYGRNSQSATFPVGAVDITDSLLVFSNATINPTVAGDRINAILAVHFDVAEIPFLFRVNTENAVLVYSQVGWNFLFLSIKTTQVTATLRMGPAGTTGLLAPVTAKFGAIAIAKNAQAVLSNTAVFDRPINALQMSRVDIGSSLSLDETGLFGRQSVTIDGLYFDGTATTKTTTTLSTQALGAQNSTIIITLRVPTVAPATDQGLFSITANSGEHGSNVGDVTLFHEGASGNLLFRLHQAAGTKIAAINSWVNRWGGQVIRIAIVHTGATLTFYVNEIQVPVTLGGTATIPSDWNFSFAGVNLHTGIRAATERFVGTIYDVSLWNRALSLTDLRDCASTMVCYADRWGSQTVLNSGTFTLGKRYRIVSRTDGAFTTVGAANNTVGTEFVATATGAGILDAGDTAVQIGSFLYQKYILSGGTIDDISANNLDATATGGVNA